MKADEAKALSAAFDHGCEAERHRRQTIEGMADCMHMVCRDLIAMGVIPDGTPPMFITEAVAAKLREYKNDADRYRTFINSGQAIREPVDVPL
jgi:hypothetical protein